MREELDSDRKDAVGLERVFNLLPSLAQLRLVFHDTLEEIESPSWDEFCRPAEFQPTNPRRLFDESFGCMLKDLVEISSSVALSGRLFETKTSWASLADSLGNPSTLS